MVVCNYFKENIVIPVGGNKKKVKGRTVYLVFVDLKGQVKCSSLHLFIVINIDMK